MATFLPRLKYVPRIQLRSLQAKPDNEIQTAGHDALHHLSAERFLVRLPDDGMSGDDLWSCVDE